MVVSQSLRYHNKCTAVVIYSLKTNSRLFSNGAPQAQSMHIFQTGLANGWYIINDAPLSDRPWARPRDDICQAELLFSFGWKFVQGLMEKKNLTSQEHPKSKEIPV